jgi:hypothetical protein
MRYFWASAFITLLAVIPMASADMGSTLLVVSASGDGGLSHGSYALQASDGVGYWDDNVYHWQLSNDINIMFNATTVGTLYALNPVTGEPATTLEFHNDPEVHLNFAVTAGTTDTVFQFTTSEATFATIYDPLGKSEVGINVSDRNHNGATLSLIAPLAGTSQSYVNGLPPPPYGGGAGSLFSDILAGPIVAPVNGTQSQQDTTAGFVPIGGAASSMSAQLNFRLTARDLASGSSTFVIMPEPSGLLLLGLLALLRRR